MSGQSSTSPSPVRRLKMVKGLGLYATRLFYKRGLTARWMYEAPPAAALAGIHGRSNKGPNSYRDSDLSLFAGLVHVLALASPRGGLVAAMDKREMIELRELLERIDRLINEYIRASVPEHLAFLETEITAAKEKLQRTAASLIN